MKLKTITINYIIEISLFILAILIIVVEKSYWWISLAVGVLIAFGVMLKGFWSLVSAEQTDNKLNEIQGDSSITKQNTEELLALFKDKMIPDDKVIFAFNKIIDECKKLSKRGKPNRALENLKQLEGFHHLIKNNNNVLLEFKVTRAKAYQEAELIDEAIALNEEIINDFPNDIRAFLYLSEIYLGVSDFKKSDKYFQQALKVNKNHPSLRAIELLRKLKLEEGIKLDDDDIWGEEDSWERSFCYYLHSVIKEQEGKTSERDDFILQAMKIEPKHLLYKTSHLEFKINDVEKEKRADDVNNLNERVREFFNDVEKLEYECRNDDAPKRKIRVQLVKMRVSFLDPTSVEERNARENYNEILKLIFKSYFDDHTDYILTMLLGSAHPLSSKKVVQNIMEYLNRFKKQPSDDLVFLLVMDGLRFFDDYKVMKDFCKEHNGLKYIQLIEAKDKNNHDAIIQELKDNYSERRILKYIINEKDDEFKIKLIDIFINHTKDEIRDVLENLKLAIFYDRKDFHTAIKLIKSTDLSKANPILLRMAFDIAHNLNFYETERDVLIRLLKLNAYPNENYVFKANLAVAHYNLKEYGESSKNGIEVLENQQSVSLEARQYILLICLHILDMDGKFPDALKLLEKYSSIQKDFRLHIMSAEVFLYNKKYKDALDSIVQGVKSVDNLKDEHFGIAHYQLIMLENASGVLPEKLNEVKNNTFVRLDGIDDWFYVGKDNPLDAIPIMDTNDYRYKILFGKKINDKIEWPGDSGRINKIKRRIVEIRCVEDYIGYRGFKTMEKDARAGSPYIRMIEVGTDPETMRESLMNFMSGEDKNFELYKTNQVPFSFFITLMGGVGNAFSKIRFSEEGFVNINFNNEDLIQQFKTVDEALAGSSVYVDGTSLFVLFESGIYKKVLGNLPNYFVPSSALDEYRTLIQKFTAIPKKGSMQIGKRGNDFHGILFNEEQAESIKKHIVEFCDYIQADTKRVFGVSPNEKNQDFIEQNILPSVSDACIKAQREEGSLLMTEDSSYALYNEQLTKKVKPKHFSVWSILRILYEKGEIKWSDYLETFYWLTVYREKFLSTNAQDIVKSIFGDSKEIRTITPQNIDKLNLSLVWSEEYGTNINSILKVVTDVLVYLIRDNTVTEDQLEIIFQKIFVPVLESRDMNYWKKKILSIVNLKLKSFSIITTINIEKRIDILEKLINRYIADSKYKIIK